MHKKDIDDVVASFLKKQDASVAALRKTFEAAGASEAELHQLDTIAAEIRNKMIKNIPGYMDSMHAMIERDLLRLRAH